MKRLKLHYVFAAAALTAVASSASAQNLLKAEIPFTFHAGQSLMDPGSYDVRLPEGTASYVTLRNIDTGKAVMAVYGSPEETRGREGLPRLTFACAGARCVLQQVWPGGPGRGYNIRAPKLAKGEAMIAREIVLTRGSSN
jgi:hypothetical protein